MKIEDESQFQRKPALSQNQNAGENEKYKLFWPAWSDILKNFILQYVLKDVEANEHHQNVRKIKPIQDIEGSVFFNMDIFGDKLEKLVAQINEQTEQFPHIALNTYKVIADNFCKGLTGGVEAEEFIKSYEPASNEFLCVFDIDTNSVTPVDDRVEQILGIKKEDFTGAALCGFDPNHPLFHPEDLYHSMRFGALAYVVFSTPSVDLVSLKDSYVTNYRIRTSSSSSEEIRNIGTVMINKRVLPVDGLDDMGYVPRKFIYIMQVRDHSQYVGVNPFFGTDLTKAIKLNSLLYVYNAFLLDFPIKSLLILHEKSKTDRNKHAANAMNTMLAACGVQQNFFNENQIGDSFSKTIRKQVGKAIDKWEMRKEPTVVQSDLEAINMAKRLGLLPMPQPIYELAYKLCYEM